MKRTLSYLSLALLSACGGGTTGKVITLHTKLKTDLVADRSFGTDDGWTVTLSKAQIATGALYYYDGAPAFTAVKPSLWHQFLENFEPIHAAYAHPGHYQAGDALGEVLEPFSADLLSGAAVDLPDGDGISGAFRSGTFSFAAPTAGPAAAELMGHIAWIEGQAQKESKTVYFRATLDLADLERTAAQGAISGCRFTPAEVSDDGTVTITVRPKIWFDLVDFAPLPEGSPEAPTPLPEDSTARIALALGLGQLSAYSMEYAR
ncbi:MAG: hypothetical protein U1E65_09180 [Myxococcota bacterium]